MPNVERMNAAEFHQLLVAAATGEGHALDRLQKLVAYGECIEKAFVTTKPRRRQLRLVAPQADSSRAEHDRPVMQSPDSSALPASPAAQT
jgi:hypothetical protein